MSAPFLYECRINHTRVSPRHHAFEYRVFMLAIDLDDFPEIPLLSKNRFNLFSIEDRDHIRTDPTKGTRQNLTAWLAEHDTEVPADARMILLSFPRVLGYAFNPVSFYYISHKSGEPIIAVAEVTNTYREMKLYPIPPTSHGKWERILPKNFYVSPFSDPNDAFRFRLGAPGESWTVHIDNLTEGKPTLLSAIHGNRRELTATCLAWFALKYPLLSLSIILRIHLHALFLFLKKIPISQNRHQSRIEDISPQPQSTHPMNPTPSELCDPPQSLRLCGEKSSSSLSERLVLSLFRKLPLGGLSLTYPDGKSLHFGETGVPITARITLNNPAEFFKRCAFYGNIGMGEAYTDAIWDTPDIAAVISWFAVNMTALQGDDSDSSTLPGVNLLKIVNWFRHLKRSNTVETSRRNIAEHYDLGNVFYSLWLDETMTYSSAKFSPETKTLADAQTEKYDALCRKLHLKSCDHVLEIGCGWGGFSHHAAQNYGCKVTAVTISEAQAAYARKRIEKAGLSDLVEIRIQDYRHITGKFDKVASIEMLEAVGHKFHESFFAKCQEVLTPHGLLGVQYITVPDNRYQSLIKGVDWIQKVIFPGSLLLSVGRVNEAINKTGNMFLHHLEDLGLDYSRTLSTWHETFNAKLDQIRPLGFDEPFIRTWNYYLKYCEAGFATRNISVVQAIYTRPNNAKL